MNSGVSDPDTRPPESGSGAAASAVARTEAALASIAAFDGRINSFSAVLADRALSRAAVIDASDRPEQGQNRLPLKGLPFAVKNLFDIQGVTTLAGSKIEQSSPPAGRDARLIERLEAQGAVCIGALHMDEYAYGFTTENTHYGACHNPHDETRVSGGSSGGSGAAVAAGFVPLSLGSDTNGSIRVPASLCGVFGLKPTYGRLSRVGTFPFVGSLDHLGPFARDVAVLAAAYDAMQGVDPDDPAQTPRPYEPSLPSLDAGISGLRIARLGGWFETMATASARIAVDRVAQALDCQNSLEWPEVARARAAAFLITNAEGAALHLRDLQTRAQDFDPMTRDRFLAGALIPAAWVQQAQRVRLWFARAVLKYFEHFDVFLAPATPCTAPVIGTEWLEVNGLRLPARASMGLLTQPVSCIGLPVCTVPIWGCDEEAPHLPIGVQVITAPWKEDIGLRVARHLQTNGVVSAPIAKGFA